MDNAIVDYLSRSEKPLSGNQIAKAVIGPQGKKKDVNSTLYRLANSGVLYHTQDQPPRWGVSSQQPTASSVSIREQKIQDINTLFQFFSDQDLDNLGQMLVNTLRERQQQVTQ